MSEFVLHRNGTEIVDFRKPRKEGCKKAKMPGACSMT
jgi:hypothetical protein